ncbi:serine/threonine kinase [Aureococcus anophagefferens]|nr:serine/threonine kinase [Aureococcus anophagefferens]
MNIQTYNAAVRAGLPVGPASLDPALALEGVVAYGSRVAGAPDDAMAFLRHAILLLRGGGGGVARTWSETALFAECAVREAHKDLRRSAAASRAAAAAPGAATSWWRSVGAPRDAGEDLARLADAAGRAGGPVASAEAFVAAACGAPAAVGGKRSGGGGGRVLEDLPAKVAEVSLEVAPPPPRGRPRRGGRRAAPAPRARRATERALENAVVERAAYDGGDEDLRASLSRQGSAEAPPPRGGGPGAPADDRPFASCLDGAADLSGSCCALAGARHLSPQGSFDGSYADADGPPDAPRRPPEALDDAYALGDAGLGVVARRGAATAPRSPPGRPCGSSTSASRARSTAAAGAASPANDDTPCCSLDDCGAAASLGASPEPERRRDGGAPRGGGAAAAPGGGAPLRRRRSADGAGPAPGEPPLKRQSWGDLTALREPRRGAEFDGSPALRKRGAAARSGRRRGARRRRRRRAGPGTLSDRVGSFYFVAPEALRGVLRGAHDARCDLWSLGVIVYILLCGAPPFAGRTDRDILTKVARAGSAKTAAASGAALTARRARARPASIARLPALFGHVSDAAVDFVTKLLDRDVDARLTADGALREPWLAAREARGPGRPRRRPEAAAETLAAARAFARLDALRKLVASVVAARLGAAELEPVRLDFADFDADGDGELSLSEFYGPWAARAPCPSRRPRRSSTPRTSPATAAPSRPRVRGDPRAAASR